MRRLTNWLVLPRAPEPEEMDDAAEVESYAAAAAEACLAAIDDTLVDQVVALGCGRGLDVGAGPGAICLKLARRCPGLHMTGVDRSETMVRAARNAALAQGLEGRLVFRRGEAARLDFPDASFDLVICNSVLHHLASPVEAFGEMARVTRPGGTVLIRDLRRPARLIFRAHAAWHGRHYSGRMKELYLSSLRAAYAPSELKALVERSALAGGRIFYHHHTHIGILWKSAFQS
ncbi:MAG: class I SAM-dependent methyltransferase [Terriglobia bacterium]